jgi:hypothetical protein
VGVALTATLMDYREDVHTLILSQRQALYPPFRIAPFVFVNIQRYNSS